MKKVKILYPFKNSEYQFFQQDMADMLIENGVENMPPTTYSWKVRWIIAKFGLMKNIKFVTKNDPIMVFGGGYIDFAAIPYGYTNEIIPFLWDTWPKYWPKLIKSLKRLNVNVCFVTQQQTKDFIEKEIPSINCFYIPESIRTEKYHSGLELSKRELSVVELGRIYSKFHNEAISSDIDIRFSKPGEMLFPEFSDLVNGLSNSKIVINFPRNITHPEIAGDVETLTQRYWECMSSRCLMVGKAPKELINLIGYNPVIDVDWSNIPSQLHSLLDNIEDYQTLVDRNYDTALKYGALSNRFKMVVECLQSCGYTFCLTTDEIM